MMRNHTPHMMFWVCVLTAGALYIQIGLYALQLLFRYSTTMNLFELCHSWLAALGLPYLHVCLDLTVLSTFAVCAWLVTRQVLLLIRAKRSILRLEERELSVRYNLLYSARRGRLTIVRTEQPVALTMGFFRPQIVLSTGLLELLDPEELEAVIRHEEYHLLQLDPLKTLLTYLASCTMWYIPILKWCHHNYKIGSEVLADRYAVGHTGSTVGLGGALLKLAKFKPDIIPLAHASFSESSVNVRIRHLIDPEMELSVRLPWRAALISLVVISMITAVILPSPL